MSEQTGRTDRGDGVHLAWTRSAGAEPTAVFFPGLRSDMNGTKAVETAGFCQALDRASLRFDYSGHGASEGMFEAGTIGRWREDALCLLDRLTEGRLVLVGSSMGAWIALLAALARPERVAGLILIAAAPDFTERLMWASMMPEERAMLLAEGRIEVPNAYGASLPVTRTLIEEGRRHLLLERTIEITAPVRLLHGQADAEVPWQTSLELAERLASTDVRLTLVKDGDHRLSRGSDLGLLRRALGNLLVENSA